MNVYELSAPPDISLLDAPEKSEKILVPNDGKKPLSHYSMLARTLRQDRNIETENEKRQVRLKMCPSRLLRIFC